MNLPELSPQHVRVFLSSPGDVSEERAIARKVIKQLEYDPQWRGKISTECIAWDKPGITTPMLATVTPQEAINENLARPSECDIVIVIFWSRMGTPLPEEYKKPDGSLYLSGTEWEFEDAVQMSEKIGGIPIVSVYRRTEPPIVAMNDPQWVEKRLQWERVESFFATFRNPDGSIKRGANLYATPTDFQMQLEQHLKQFVRQLLVDRRGMAKGIPARPSDKWYGSPFPGLRAFMPEDAPIFWGRHRETDTLLRKVQMMHFVTVVGASGSGKSSLVGAGLISHLQAGSIEGSQDWTTLRFSPGEKGKNPFIGFAAQFARLIDSPTDEIATRLFNSPLLLVEYCDQILKGKSEWAQVIIIIDQFEEMFTIVEKEFHVPFVEMISNASDGTHPIRFVITLRADFYHYCVEWPKLALLLENGSFPIAPPDQFALHDMITRPAERAALEFEGDLAERIVSDTGDEPGALALMAYVLDELYRNRTETGLLTFDAYQKLGGVKGAIGKRAEYIFGELDTETQAELFPVFRHLLTVDERGVETRHRALYSQLATSKAAEHLVQTFTTARLLVQNSSESQDEITVEVAHEALLRSWPRLANWINEIRDDLRLLRQVIMAAEDWRENSQDPAFLWPDERLRRVNAMLERQNPQISDTLKQFIRPESHRILDKIDILEIDHFERSVIGTRIATIGDPRSGVGLRVGRLPDIQWQEVPSGKVQLVNHPLVLEVGEFSMSRYPVTCQQFSAFVEAPDGYRHQRWWESLPRNEKRSSNPTSNFDNHPRDMVNWYEAVAFCRWLTVRSDLPENQVIRLPTEWEWQQAATGGRQNYEYPWGEMWDKLPRANTIESGLNRITSVGLYPLGQSPIGTFDMCGNIWEWCLNDPDMLSIDTRIDERRVVRGGSWDDSCTIATTSYRDGQDASIRSGTIGFRVCLASSRN